MNKILITLFLSSFSLLAAAQSEEKIKASSSIKEVTVFLSGAQISRVSNNTDIPKGVSYVVFEGVSADINEKSIQVKGTGAFTILSVSRQLNFLKESKSSDPDQIFTNKVKEYDAQLTNLNNDLEVYKAEEQMLMKNQTVINGNTTYDVLKLKQALDFQRERLKTAKNKQAELMLSIRKLSEEAAVYKKQYLENNGVTNTTSTDVVVKVSSANPVKGSFTLNYMVKNASWYPFYDIRAKDITSKVNLVYKANVLQNSGEDWKNVKLILSTGNPTVDNQIPVLKKYDLGYTNMGYGLNFLQNNLSVVSGKVFDADGQPVPGASIRLKNNSLGTTSDANGNYSIQLPASSVNPELIFSALGFENKQVSVTKTIENVFLANASQQLSEVVVVGYGAPAVRNELQGRVAGLKLKQAAPAAGSSIALEVTTEEQPTNIIFSIKNPYSINSDGKNFTVDIASYDVATNYEYYAIPKLSQNVFLLANLTDFQDLNLITGEASVFFDGTYMGKTLINSNKVSDTLSVSLGIDKNVVISREKEKEFKETQFLGSNKKESRSFVIEVKNKKSSAINITVEDHMPIPANNEITVEKQDVSNAVYDDKSGKLLWKLNLPAGKEQKLYLKYQVKSPRNKVINLE